MEKILLSIVSLLICTLTAYAGEVCSSVDIKREQDLEKLRECTTVVGHVRISNFRLLGTSNIASPLEEITDYLLIYRVEELDSLEYIFPNLTIIRGHELLFDKYSLIVYENRNIRYLGLNSLLKIRRGSIQIESNPVLCFADTINWIYLMEDHSLQHYSIKDNKDLNECPICMKNMTISPTEYLRSNCWNLKNFQRKKPFPHQSDCPKECGTNGCTEEYECCSALCLTGCLATNCRICKNYKNIEGNCVESCLVPYYMLADQCVTAEECRKRDLIPHAGTCVAECPRSYQQINLNGMAQCNLLCNRNFTIRNKDDLEDLRDCVTIRGSLHIELKDDKTHIIAELETALGGIKEISGWLKITKSPQLVSLGFFKKLDTIKGDQLIDGEIAFYVVDNFHLEEIWPQNHKVAILKGRIFFHLNPRLCFDKILQLAPSIRNNDEILVRDASRNSNGERIICGSNIYPLNPSVEATNATAVRIKLDALHSYDKDIVLGYLHYYKEAPVKNVTMFDGRHGCGRDHWKMDMTLDRNVRHVISNLRPYTQYAYFVKTFTMVDYHMKKDWYSSIHYFRTAAMKPGPVEKMYSTSLSASTIIVRWWPPKDVNGVIDKYLLRYEALKQYIDHSKISGYYSNTRTKNCECGIPINKRGPPPDDLNYYNRNQVVVDEAIPNTIFISSETIRRIEDERRIEDRTRRKRETNISPKDQPNSVEFTQTIPKKTILTEEQEKIDNETDIELKFRKHLEALELKSFQEQDNGTASFPIEQPQPICSIINPSKKYEEDYNCTGLESYEGIEIPSNMHSYTLENLEPDVVYQISMRACVEGLANACGREISIQAETVTKSMEYFLKGP